MSDGMDARTCLCPTCNVSNPTEIEKCNTCGAIRVAADLRDELRKISWNDWHRPAEGTIILKSIPLAGATFDNPDGVNRQDVLAQMQQWERVDLVREPDNPHDAYAVAVISSKGRLGYVPRDHAQRIATHLDSGHLALAKLSGLFGGHDGKSYGAKLEIHLVPPVGTSVVEFKVVGMTGRNSRDLSRQEVAEDIQEGDSIFLAFDFDEKRNVEVVGVYASGYGDFGRLGKLDAERVKGLLEKKGTLDGYVSFADFGENDKPKIQITISTS